MSDTLSVVSIGDEWLAQLIAAEDIRPEVQCYGQGENLRLDEEAAAVYVECGEGTIYREYERGKLTAEPSRSKRPASAVQDIRTYPLFGPKGLRAFRERRQRDKGNDTYDAEEKKRHPLRKIAPKTRLGYQTLLRVLGVHESKESNATPETKKKKKKNKRHRLDGLLIDLGLDDIKPEKIRPAFGGKEEWTLLNTEAVKIGWAIDLRVKQGKRKGFSTSTEIADKLDLPRTPKRCRLTACLDLWVKLGLLERDFMLTWRKGKVTTRTDKRSLAADKLYRHELYDEKKAIQLWNTLDAKAATKKLRSLLPDGPRNVVDVHTEMHNAGFPDHLIYEAVQRLKAVRRISSFRGPQTYEIPKTLRKSARAVLEDIFKDGPALVSTVKDRLREAGWSFHSPAVKKAAVDLQVRKIPAPGQKWWWCRPGQEPPLIPSPSVQRAIDFVVSYLADEKPRPFQAIIAAASERGIKKQRLIDAAPFLKSRKDVKLNIIRERDPKGKLRSSTWQLLKAEKAGNSENGQSHESEPEPKAAPKRRGRPRGWRDPVAEKRNKNLIQDFKDGKYESIAALGRAHHVSRARARQILEEAGALV